CEGGVGMREGITFRKFELGDMEMLHGWLNQSHMREFYQKKPISLEEVTQKYSCRALNQTPTHTHIVQHQGKSIGKIQCYKLSDYPDFSNQIGVSDGASVDLFIGDPSYLGRGLGRIFLKQYVEDIVFPLFHDISKCYIVHEIGNIGALKASKAAGFEFLQDVYEDGVLSELLCYRKGN
ncbi:MAG: GNAT family N-acetyltransferase, partial [Alphaproteobacteria bacterium]